MKTYSNLGHMQKSQLKVPKIYIGGKRQKYSVLQGTCEEQLKIGNSWWVLQHPVLVLVHVQYLLLCVIYLL